MSKPTLFTIVGTRPELIRLSRLIPKFDAEFNHILIHTGQNFDTMLSDVFFDELRIRTPDYFLNINGKSLAGVLGDVLLKTEELIDKLRPSGVFVLGDTNSAISAVIAKRMQVAVYHWEAGNRSFDENVPEETNRKIVDHVADFNIAYSKPAYQNLINEGLKPERLLMSGSPLKEVIDYYSRDIGTSNILDTLGVNSKKYFVASFHRQENVDSPERLKQIVQSLNAVNQEWKLPILVSTHPRTRAKLEDAGLHESSDKIMFHEPFGYFDYMTLQLNAKCVLSDSGTISEESAILDFPAITVRDSMERPEALKAGTIKMTGLESDSVIEGIRWALTDRSSTPPEEYLAENASDLVVDLVRATLESYEDWSGVRKLS